MKTPRREKSGYPVRKQGENTSMAQTPTPQGLTLSEPGKTPSETPIPMREGLHGGQLRSGNPGNVGGGRPPDWLKKWCDDILYRPSSKKQVEEILDDKNHPAHATMWKAVSERAHGRPSQPIEHSGNVSLLEAIVGAAQK